MEVVDGKIVETFADGTFKVIKELPVRMKVEIGSSRIRQKGN